jgi:O-antigen ligase
MMCPAIDRRSTWGAAPLIASAFLQGIPLTLSLEESVLRNTADARDATLEAVTSLGLQRAWLPAAISAALYLVAAWSLHRERRPAPVLHRRNRALILLLVLIAASATWSQYPAKVMMNVAHALGAMLIAAAAARHYAPHGWTAVRHLGFAFGLITVIHLATSVAFPNIAVDWDGRWRGLTTNANTLGLVGCCAAWANLAAAVRSGLRTRVVHSIMAAAGVVALIKSHSMTSMMAASVAVSGVLILRALTFVRNAHARVFVLVSLVAVASGALVLVIGISDATSSWAHVTGVLGKSSDLTGRATLWSQAAEAILERPILGWGFDDNATVIEHTSLPFLHFHNGYLDLGVRGGAAALSLLATLFATALWRTRGSFSGALGVSVAYHPFIAAVAVYNLTEVTFAASRNIMWILFLFVFFLGTSRHDGPKLRRSDAAVPVTLDCVAR